MRGLFFQVLEMSATASVVILIVLALRLCLRKAPKVYSYALWSVVLFRLLCPFSIESGLSILPHQTAATRTEIAQYEAIEAGEEYLAAYHAMGDALNGGLDFIDVKLEPEYLQTLEDGAQQATISLTHGEVWTLLLSSLWPVGALFLLGRSLVSMWKLKRGLRGAIRLRENIYLTANIQTPFTMGLLKPIIYLPEGLGEHEQDYIICHEQYHVRRGDHIVKVFAFMALCLHWFNPLVWLAFHLAGKDMEMSCDEAVVKRMGAGIRADYSQSLLTLATGRRMAVGTHLAFGDGDTKGRIKNVLNWKKPKVWVSILAVVVCVIAAVVCITDPAQPIDTDKIGAVTFMEWGQIYGENGDSDPADRHPVYGTAGVPDPWKSQLFDLINSHSATRRFSLPERDPMSYEMENQVRLSMQREGYFELASWYVNGFSFNPLHYGEDEYDTTLAQYTADGELVACWTMDYDFDRPFRELLRELAKWKDAGEALLYGDEYYLDTSFVTIHPGETHYLDHKIVLAGDGSAVTYEAIFGGHDLTLGIGLLAEDGTEYIKQAKFEQIPDARTEVNSFRELPAGAYRPFVRNLSASETAHGKTIFHSTSPKDMFQNRYDEQQSVDEVPEESIASQRDMAITDLKPGHTIYLNEDIVLSGEDSTVTYHITYARPGLSMQVGLRKEDGQEIVHTFAGGSHIGTFKDFSAGVYTPFVRNMDEAYREEPNASGAIVFNLTSPKDFFQKSTPFVQEEPVQPVKLTPEEVLHNAILDHHRSSQSGQYFCCESHIVLANEEGTRCDPATGGDLKTRNYFLWVLYQEYLFTEDGIVDEGGAHIPTNITLGENADGSWTVLNYWEPRDGSYYAEEIRATFPGSSAEDALDSQKYIMAQKQNCYEQAVEYAKTDSDVKMDVDAVIEGLLEKICSEPMPFSYTWAYLEAHPIEYRELLYYGDYTREYCARKLQSESGDMGLRRAIREMLLEELDS